MGLPEAQAALNGCIAAVIGGAGGMGRTVSLALAQAGVDIACCDIDAEAVRAIGPELTALGRRVLALEADAADVAALDRFYDRVTTEFSRLDIVVNVVGGVRRGPLLDTTREQNARDIRLNYGYVVDSVRRAIPLLRASGRGGSIINFTTIEAHRGAATFAVYAGAKAATTNFSRAMAVELGADGIRVNTIAPDTTPVRGSFNALYPRDIERLAELGANALSESYNMYIPQQRAPSQEDVANAVLFLASDLSRAITGTTLHVDGGTYAAFGFLKWPYDDGFMPAPLGGTLRHLFPVK